ncbi:MAG TPA: nucleotide disphospho-sugar-binding domain-containing protein [Kofleriaceae bacterium]|nr:nucleotide disphospho-sugar-binding domain-containing protein [Kofleriaceae bacterium]
MARLLVATVPLTGHVHPMLLLVRALVARGHHVQWYAAKKFARAIQATGAAFAPMRAAHDWDDAEIEAALPALRGTRGLARVKAQLRAMFIDPAPDQLRDLEALAGEARPDAILADQAHLGAALLAEKHGLPWAGLGISALMAPSIDTAPFGSARRPARAGEPRWIYRLLNWLIFRVLFRGVNRAYQRARAAAGLPPTERTYFEVMAPRLYLQPTVPAFEYPRSDLPAQVQFIGPLVPSGAPAAARPPWWSDLAAARARGTPIVLVTQGTLATDPRELIAPALRALADEPVLVVATSGAAIEEPPANARIAPFIPYQALMPLLSAVVTNGGYGGVQMALAAGVPLVVAGGSEEKPEIAARVQWSGAGIDLRTGRPKPARIRAAVRRALGEPGFRDRARAIAEDMAVCDAPARGAVLIEQLIEPPLGAAAVGRASVDEALRSAAGSAEAR